MHFPSLPPPTLPPAKVTDWCWTRANTGPPAELQTAVVGCEEEAHSAFTDQTACICELEWWASSLTQAQVTSTKVWYQGRKHALNMYRLWNRFCFSCQQMLFCTAELLCGREFTSRSTWKMHGQDVSNCATVALCKGVITLNNAHAFT